MFNILALFGSFCSAFLLCCFIKLSHSLLLLVLLIVELKRRIHFSTFGSLNSVLKIVHRKNLGKNCHSYAYSAFIFVIFIIPKLKLHTFFCVYCVFSLNSLFPLHTDSFLFVTWSVSVFDITISHPLFARIFIENRMQRLCQFIIEVATSTRWNMKRTWTMNLSWRKWEEEELRKIMIWK